MENNSDQLVALRHSMSHVMAEAVLSVYPQAKIAIGPAIDNGFYYEEEDEKNHLRELCL
jgi:threonyl-tRNA synthetase